ncbi:MAG: TRAP transporter small permease subunit [Castellaniella sp.]|uniref:TRAP transporter small permease protein n=1 Tax=Castellaniella hirudinis TaxID=1144617 RepID=A0ABV8S120_9BURK
MEPSPSGDPLSAMRLARDRVQAQREQRAARPGRLIMLQRCVMVATGVAVTTLMSIQIVTRYLFGFSIYGIEELMSFIAVWLYFIGSAHGAWGRGQISASLLDVALPFGQMQQACRTLACLVTTVLCGWMTVWSAQYFLNSVHRHLMSLEVGIPMAWVNISMPIGLALMTFYFLIETLEEFSILRGRT